ncbi:MAG: ribosome maturation factor [Bacteroidota bacterium]
MADQLMEGKPFFVLDVNVSPGKSARIRVVVDGDRSVTIDDCADISRELNDRIDGSGLLEDYNLEVTTPGVDQPLKVTRQFAKHEGRNLKITLRDGTTERGQLKTVLPDGLLLAREVKKAKKGESGELVTIPFTEIEKTFVLISFK